MHKFFSHSSILLAMGNLMRQTAGVEFDLSAELGERQVPYAMDTYKIHRVSQKSTVI